MYVNINSYIPDKLYLYIYLFREVSEVILKTTNEPGYLLIFLLCICISYLPAPNEINEMNSTSCLSYLNNCSNFWEQEEVEVFIGNFLSSMDTSTSTPQYWQVISHSSFWIAIFKVDSYFELEDFLNSVNCSII